METTIQATVDVGRLLRKVDRVFDASPRTVFGELLQNARRAGATEVQVNLDKVQDLPGYEQSVMVTFADDGKGIEDPQVLLNLAGPGWDEFTEADEDPAGMGFFSLSNFVDVTVYSKTWFAHIPKEAFHGEEPVIVRKAPTPLEKGARIVWWWNETSPYELKTALEGAAKHCGLERVIIKTDDDTKVIEPSDYLEGHECAEAFTEKGYSIAVWTSSTTTGTSTSPPRVWLNFWGTETHTQLPEECAILGKLRVSLRVDVWRTGKDDLQMVLPARNAVVHNERLRELFEDCERKLYEFTATKRHNDHNLPYAGYKRAQELGFDIGEAKISPSFYDEGWLGGSDREELLSRLVILEKPLAEYRYVRQLFEVTRDEGQHKLYAMKPQPWLEGYGWYDNLPRISDLTITIDGKSQDTEEIFSARADYREDDDEVIFKFVDSLTVVYSFSDGTEIEFLPEVLVAGDQTASEWDSVDYDTELFVIAEAKTDDVVRDDIVRIVNSTVFVHDFGCDAEPLDEQENEFMRGLRYAVLEACCSDMDAARWELESAIKRFYAGRDDRFAWWVRWSPRGGRREPEIVSFRKWNAEEQHKIVATIPRNSDGTAYQLVSDEKITPARVERYLVWEHEHDAADDGFILDIAGDPVNLDEWEAKMKSQGIDVSENPPTPDPEQ